MTQTKQCQRCKMEFTVEHGEDQFSTVFASLRKFCEPCGMIESTEAMEREVQKREEAKKAQWLEICPPRYAATDITHSGILPTFRAHAMAWSPKSSEGLGFMGASGAGKTRMLFVALKRAFEEGLTVRQITHNEFSKLVIDAFISGHGESREESRRSLDALAKVRVLLIDDLGKAPSTERCDAELEELIEKRGSHLLPTLWSANGYGEWLVKRFGADRGEPLVRRLSEFSTVVNA